MFWKAGRAVAFLMAGGIAGWSQSAVSELNPLGPPGRGLRLDNVSLFGSYSTLTFPGGSFGLSNSAAPLGADFNVGGGASLAWRNRGERTKASFAYGATYFRLVRHSDWSALNHSLSFHVGRKMGRAWEFSLGLNGSASNTNQFLFMPAVPTQVTQAGAGFEDLAAAMVSGKYTNDQLASILTGAPVVESPARTLIYGNRVLSAGAATTLSYSPNTRLSYHIGVTAFRAQYLDDGQEPAIARYRALVPRSVRGGASLGVSYKLSPRTDIGVETSANRANSRYENAYTTTARITLGRKMSQRWFLNGFGGGGKIIPISETPHGRRLFQYSAGGSLGFRTRAHTFVASSSRDVGDSYGLGAGWTLASNGSWTWRRPGGSWGASVNAGWQRYGGARTIDTDGWIASASISRSLSRETSVQIAYSYMKGLSQFLMANEKISVQSARLAFVWAPR